MLRMKAPIIRLRSPHDVGEGWTTADASELYEIARWGQGYFSIGDNGHVQIHPTKDASRSIDLKQLVDDLQLRGIGLPTLIRFRDILQHRLQEISRSLSGRYHPARVFRPLHLRLPHQGQSAAAGRRGGARLRPAIRLRPRGGVEARAAGRGGARRQRHAHHLQRLQGRRNSSRWRCWRRRSAATSSRSSRNTRSSI